MIHVYNRTLIHHLKWQTPFEALRNDKPDVSHLHIFGCGAYVFLPEDIRANKLSPKSSNQPGSSHALPKQPTQNPIPGSSRAPPPLHQTTTDADNDTGEDPVDTSGQAWLNCLVWEGRVEFIAFLLNRAVPMASDQPVFYKDIAKLPSQL